MVANVSPVSGPARSALVRRGLLLVAASITWMLIEGGVGIASGLAARSVALVGFGVDSFIELVSDGIVAWRLLTEQRGGSGERIERVERVASRLAGGLLWCLAGYVGWAAGSHLLGHGEHAAVSPGGIAVTVAALVIMPLLARGKLRVAAAIGSAALRADAMEAVCCAWLAGTTLAGLALNAAFHWWWADPAAALFLVPLLIREGREAWSGECGGCSCSG